ncbi:MAG: hypothetical protein J3R72DRAFT_451100 [Linnemannia gamsii]|nr:MAG: hypothetical protein J3R72DRAFT_451100 [Linnemannia gamsii]
MARRMVRMRMGRAMRKKTATTRAWPRRSMISAHRSRASLIGILRLGPWLNFVVLVRPLSFDYFFVTLSFFVHYFSFPFLFSFSFSFSFFCDY